MKTKAIKQKLNSLNRLATMLIYWKQWPFWEVELLLSWYRVYFTVIHWQKSCYFSFQNIIELLNKLKMLKDHTVGEGFLQANHKQQPCSRTAVSGTGYWESCLEVPHKQLSMLYSQFLFSKFEVKSEAIIGLILLQ